MKNTRGKYRQEYQEKILQKLPNLNQTETNSKTSTESQEKFRKIKNITLVCLGHQATTTYNKGRSQEKKRKKKKENGIFV